MMAALTRMSQIIRGIYSWPAGPQVLLRYATVATLILLLSVLHTVWIFVFLFWPTLWIMRALISILARIPTAQRRRDEKGTRL
jgi:hypothetical protein